MKPGDLVKVAMFFTRSEEKPWKGVPDFSIDPALGVVMELAKFGGDANVLIGGSPTWVAISNLEIVEPVQAG